MSAQQLGNRAEDSIIDFQWDSNDGDGASITRATDGTVEVYKGNSTTQSTAGVTDNEDFDGVTGRHHVRIDLSADAFYETGFDYSVVLTGATIDGQVVNPVLAHFSIENRFAEVTVPGGVAVTSMGANVINQASLDADIGSTAHASNKASQAAEKALIENELDHLAKEPCAGNDINNAVVDHSIFAKMLAINGDISEWDGALHVLQAIFDSIAAAVGTLFFPNSSSAILTGTEDSGTFASTAQLDNVFWVIGDADGANTIDVVCELEVGAERIASELDVNGYYNRSGGGVFVVEIWAWDYIGGVWSKLSTPIATKEMRHRTSATNYVFALASNFTDQVTNPGEVKINFRSTRPTTGVGDTLRLDRVQALGQTGALSAEATADAVANHPVIQGLNHIPQRVQTNLYVDGNNGSDANEGNISEEPLATIGAAIAKVLPGQCITVGAGVYTETGLDLDVDGVQMFTETGAVITGGGTGTGIIISGNYCLLVDLEITPGAGQIGLQITGTHARLSRVCSHGGATGFQVVATASENLFLGCQASEYTVAGFDLRGPSNGFMDCAARGDGSTKGFYLSDDAAHFNVFTRCVTISNSGAGWETIVGADNNTFAFCVDSADDGPRADAGAANVWRFFGDSDVAAANVTAMAAAVITAAAHATDSIAADAIAADAVIKLQAGLATLVALGLHDDALTVVDGLVTAIKAQTDNLPALPASEGGAGDTLETLSNQIDAIVAGGDATLVKQDEILAAIAALPEDADIAALQVILDKVNTMLELSGANYRFTAEGLALAPTGTGSPSMGD